MRPIPLFAFLLIALLCRPPLAGARTVTFYLDGARVEDELLTGKGVLEYRLPESAVSTSLRVKPAGEGKLLRVELLPAERDSRRAREISTLERRKRELEERMQILSRREGIFSAALRSQSGKAPRKSRSNPDPLASLREGTAFAVGQLDAVLRSQQKCQRTMEEVDRKLAAARKGAPVVRIWLTGRKATVSFLVANRQWTPSYHFRWSEDGSGELLLHAKLPAPEWRVLRLVSNGTVSQGAPARPVQGEYPLIARYPLTLQGEGRGQQRPTSFTFQPIEASLPPGEGALFWQGEYLGSGRFSGGASSQFSIGGQ